MDKVTFTRKELYDLNNGHSDSSTKNSMMDYGNIAKLIRTTTEYCNNRERMSFSSCMMRRVRKVIIYGFVPTASRSMLCSESKGYVSLQQQFEAIWSLFWPIKLKMHANASGTTKFQTTERKLKISNQD